MHIIIVICAKIVHVIVRW